MSKLGTAFEQALMNRDGLSKQEAAKKRQEAMHSIQEVLADGGSYEEVEDMLAYEYGLEMDYVLDLI